MFPSFPLFGREIALYGLLAACGMLAAGFFACLQARRAGRDDNDAIAILLWAAVGVLAGGHLLYGAVSIGQYWTAIWTPGWLQSPRDLLEALVSLFGGSVFYGGLLGGLLAGRLYIRRAKLPLGPWSDLMAPAIPLFHTFGRVGCFLGGCCYGIESRVGFTMRISPAPGANGVSRFPVQLVEAGFNLCLFLLLLVLYEKGRLRGRLLYLYLAVYAAGRFLLEFLRGDLHRGLWLGLSTSQIISLALLVIVPLLWRRARRKAEASR